MWKILFVLLGMLLSMSGCKESTSTHIKKATPEMQSTNKTEVGSEVKFRAYTNHVPVNAEVMTNDKRNQLNPVTKELVSLLDDYVYAFNKNDLKQGGDKFSSVDTPASEIMPGSCVIKISATDIIKVIDQYTVGIVANVEARYKSNDESPFWKGKQWFMFTVSGDGHFILGYWNSPSVDPLFFNDKNVQDVPSMP